VGGEGGGAGKAGGAEGVVTRPWELSPAAQQSLSEIAAWTLDRFGPRQAEAYLAGLTAAFDRLAAGTLRGRSCRREWGRPVPEAWRLVPVKSHVVIYADLPERVLILDVPHGAMDLPGRMREW
jgi:toxin ParE1/3/4